MPIEVTLRSPDGAERTLKLPATAFPLQVGPGGDVPIEADVRAAVERKGVHNYLIVHRGQAVAHGKPVPLETAIRFDSRWVELEGHRFRVDFDED